MFEVEDVLDSGAVDGNGDDAADEAESSDASSSSSSSDDDDDDEDDDDISDGSAGVVAAEPNAALQRRLAHEDPACAAYCCGQTRRTQHHFRQEGGGLLTSGMMDDATAVADPAKLNFGPVKHGNKSHSYNTTNTVNSIPIRLSEGGTFCSRDNDNNSSSSTGFQPGSYTGGHARNCFALLDPCDDVMRSRSSDSIMVHGGLRKQHNPHPHSHLQPSHIAPASTMGTHSHSFSERDLRSMAWSSGAGDGPISCGGSGVVHHSTAGSSAPSSLSAANASLLFGGRGDAGNGRVGLVGGVGVSPGDSSGNNSAGGGAIGRCGMSGDRCGCTARGGTARSCFCSSAGDVGGGVVEAVPHADVGGGGGVASCFVRFLKAAGGKRETRLRGWAGSMPPEDQAYLGAMLSAGYC